jgi:hypothetical protein
MAGRPRKYKSVEEMQIAIDAYFENEEHYTITGLALALGFTSRLALIRVEGYGKEYSNAIKKAKLKVENFYEKKLTGQSAAGIIFALKNFEWSDKQEIQHSNEKIEIEITGSEKWLK